MSRKLGPLHQRRRNGFAAIELVLVVAATSVVVALGVSMYRTYSVRTEVATIVEETRAVQDLVVAAFKTRGMPPFNAAAAGVDDTARRLLAGPYVESIEISNGRIELRFGTSAHPAIVGKTLSLTPFETTDQDVVWICGNKSPGVGLKPLGFAGGGPQAMQLTASIEVRYLPSSCR
jgi:Tfp pilus assembly major pilin PilA